MNTNSESINIKYEELIKSRKKYNTTSDFVWLGYDNGNVIGYIKNEKLSKPIFNKSN